MLIKLLLLFINTCCFCLFYTRIN